MGNSFRVVQVNPAVLFLFRSNSGTLVYGAHGLMLLTLHEGFESYVFGFALTYLVGTLWWPGRTHYTPSVSLVNPPWIRHGTSSIYIWLLGWTVVFHLGFVWDDIGTGCIRVGVDRLRPRRGKIDELKGRKSGRAHTPKETRMLCGVKALYHVWM